jgi:hypothetical protein
LGFFWLAHQRLADGAAGAKNKNGSANTYDQAISASWYYPPEEWKPLGQWHGETCRILDKQFEPTV